MTLKIFGRKNQTDLSARQSGSAFISSDKAIGAQAGKPGARVRNRIETWASCTVFWPPDERMKGICVDVSASGARVRFGQNLRVPSHVRLVSAQLGLNREAVLVRTDGLDAAFRFLE